MRTNLFQHPKGIGMPLNNQIRYLPACLVSLFLILINFIVVAQSLPGGFTQVQVAGGISNPTVMAFAPDGRIFVGQQNGQLRVIKDGSLLPQPFLSLSVSSSGERGLLGIAFDPDFNSNRYIYVYYTVSSGAHNRISRFTANGDLVVSGSEQVILNLDPLSDATNHNGGTMMFGPDGKLYVGVGENANAINAQRTDTYHGKLLRLNSDGSVPPQNPFSSGGAQQQRIWAYGLRNPFTIAFQPGTGRLFVNDVGASEAEEINDATSGGKNFGWPQQEGYGDNSFSNPLYVYDHGSGCAITGGTFFNPSSTNYPSTYIGKYFFLDFCGNWIDVLTLNGGSASRSGFASSIAGSPLSLTTGRDGNLYFLSRDNNAVYKIVYAGGGSAPIITGQPKNITVTQGDNAVFSVTATGTAPLSYQWRKNGVNISGATAPSYTMSNTTTANAGTYSVVVSNALGSVTSNNATLIITTPNQPPVATITTPVAGSTYAGGSMISFSGTATDLENGALPSSSYIWYVMFHHDTHTHPGPATSTTGSGGSFAIPNAGETATNVFYRLYLVVTDQQGAKDTTYRDILPRTSAITINTNPQGLTVTLDGQPFTAPLTVNSVEGIIRSIGTTASQILNSVRYNFSSWSNGGAQTQTFATPVNNISFTATFIPAPIAPTISTQPQNLVLPTGSSATFRVIAGGTAPLTYQWRKNGVNITGATGTIYTISSIAAADAGTYSVVVSNEAGSATSNSATLTVASAPVIISQPQSVTVAEGSNASFSVTATGTAPMSYQWRRNGININSATNSSVNIQSASSANAGSYSVVVSNAYGSATSNSATLSIGAVINRPPVATITSPASGTTYAGGNVINYSGTGTDPDDGSISQSAFTWFVVFYHGDHGHPGPGLVPGETSGSFTIPNTGETASDVFYRLHLVVEDEEGLRDTSYTDIYPRTSEITFNSSPQGLNLVLDGALHKTPFTVTSVEGVIRTISTPTPQAAGEAIYYFSNWSHGGTQSQTIITPVSDASYTAVFIPSLESPLFRDPDNPSNVMNGLDYAYYHGTWNSIPDFASLYKVKVGTVSNFNLNPRTENSNFGFQFSGYVLVPADDVYTFSISSDEGSRLYIGDSLIINNDGIHSVEERLGQIGLKAGLHRITVQYFENAGDQLLEISYEGAGISKQLIPNSVLFREQPTQYVFNPIADAYVRNGVFLNVNMLGGATPTLIINRDDASGDEYQTYLRFDISSLRNDISSVKLRLYGVADHSPTDVGVFNVPDWRGWLEHTITFGNKPPGEETLLATATVTGTDSGYYEWDLTQHIAQLRMNGVYYVSLLIKCISGNNDNLVTFHSRENQFNKPELVVITNSLITEARPAQTSQQTSKIAPNALISAEVSFSVYPNPVRNSFTIKYSPAFKNRRLQITDVSGASIQQVLLTESGTQTIQVGNLKEGLYFLSMYHNHKRYTQRIIVSR